MVDGINCESCANHSHDHLRAKRHEKNGHACDNESCSITDPHGHRTLSKVFPFEEKIKNLKVSSLTKQLLTMVSNLTPAISVSEIAGAFHINSFISSPLAISSMHFTNRGANKKHLPKLFLTALSSIGVLAAQKFAELPRVFIRPAMAFAVFFIEKIGAHVHTDKYKHSHDHKENNHKEHSHNKIKKSDWINLGKLQTQINTVPWLVNSFTSKLKELNEQNDNFIIKFLGHIGISISHIAALSLGFVGLGYLIDKSLSKLEIVTDKESIAMRAEGAVCACCGAPVCVAEAASEAGVMSIAA